MMCSAEYWTFFSKTFILKIKLLFFNFYFFGKNTAVLIKNIPKWTVRNRLRLVETDWCYKKVNISRMKAHMPMANELFHPDKIQTRGVHTCKTCSNLEMETKYLMKSDNQLKSNISRAKKSKKMIQGYCKKH